VKKKKSYKRRSKREQKRSLIRIALRCLGVVFCLFLLCSCLSFDLGDWPSKYQAPHNEPAANWCGSIGAFCAYNLLYYIGPGIFVVLVATISFLVIKLANREIGQPILRTIGLVLVTVAASMSFYCLWPGWLFGFQAGSGGVLGVGLTQILRGHFASLGTFILLVAVWIVGVVLLADGVMVALLHGFGFVVERLIGAAVPAWSAARQHSQVLSEIWRELSAKQKPVVLAEGTEEAVEEEWEEEEPEEGEAAEEEAAEEPADIEVRRKVKKKRPRPNAQRDQGAFVQPSYDDYDLPPLDLLAEPEHTFPAVQEKVVKSKAADLETLLSEFNINAKVVAAETGPVVTMFELELAAGVKVSQISALSNDMARALAAGAVRVVAPLPGKHTIGIEVPNSEKERVRIKNMIELAGSKPQKMQIPLYLGKDSSGEALVSDLTKMPHLLIAGTTGSGKSVCINSIVVGVLLTKRPDEVKMILIDPKMVEMTAFNTIPHLMCPIVTETKMAVQILEWATVKMDERYALLAEAKVKNIADFNKLGAEEISKRFNAATEEEEAKIPKKLPYIVIIIDELADLMMTAAKEIDTAASGDGCHRADQIEHAQPGGLSRGRQDGQPDNPGPKRRRNASRRRRHAVPQARYERSYPCSGNFPGRRRDQANRQASQGRRRAAIPSRAYEAQDRRYFRDDARRTVRRCGPRRPRDQTWKCLTSPAQAQHRLRARLADNRDDGGLRNTRRIQGLSGKRGCNYP